MSLRDPVRDQDLLEIQLRTLHDVVDVHLLAERPFALRGGGDVRFDDEPTFLRRFQAGWLKDLQSKIVYVFQGRGKKDKSSFASLMFSRDAPKLTAKELLKIL